MKIFIFVILFFSSLISYGQLEISTGYAINKRQADGIPFNFAYDFKIKNKLFTKTQIGYKQLNHYNDFVSVSYKVSILEIHQMLSYELIKNKKYILKPNIGFNYRFYKWKGKMELPYNSLPQRVYIIDFRDYRMKLNSFVPVNSNDGNYSDNYNVNNLGFSFQLQNQFKLTEKLWFHITPFLEPDYDRIQNTGGVYIGAILKNL